MVEHEQPQDLEWARMPSRGVQGQGEPDDLLNAKHFPPFVGPWLTTIFRWSSDIHKICPNSIKQKHKQHCKFVFSRTLVY